MSTDPGGLVGVLPEASVSLLALQLDLFGMMKEEHVSKEMVTVMVLHDMSFESRFADHLTVMHQGKVHSDWGNHPGDGRGGLKGRNGGLHQFQRLPDGRFDMIDKVRNSFLRWRYNPGFFFFDQCVQLCRTRIFVDFLNSLNTDWKLSGSNGSSPLGLVVDE